MRTSLLFLASLGFVVACGPLPSLYIHHMKAGRLAERHNGENIKIQRQDPEQYGHAQPGYFAIKSDEEWNQYWRGQGSKAKNPGVDYAQKMVLIAATETAGTQAIRMNSVVEDGTSMYVYVAATRAGSDCPTRTEGQTKQDLIIVDRTEKPIHFYEEITNATSCGDAPLATVECTVAGKPAPAPEFTANPGEAVECTSKVQVRGVFAQSDSHWTWLEHPASSSAKLAYDATGTKVKFIVDVFGRYGLKFEVRDDAGRLGESTALVKVGPQKDGLLVQLGWTGFDRNDDPSTFPRITLLATGPDASRPDCSLDTAPKPSWCDIAKQGPAQTTLRFAGAMEGAYRLAVKYTDDRFVGGPIACVRIFLNGEQKQEVCDREARKAGQDWTLGAVIARTGSLEPLRDDGKAPDVTASTGGTTPGRPAGTKPTGTKPSGTKPAGTKPAAPKPAGSKAGKPSGKPVFNP